MKMIRTFILLLCILPASSSFCQSTTSQMELILKAELDSLASGGNTINRYQFDASNARYFLNFLTAYENSSRSIVQLRVLDLKSSIALGSIDTAIRQEVVLDLLHMLDRGAQVSQFASDLLTRFTEKDFSNKARQVIEAGFSRYQSNHNFIMICGIAQVKNLIPSLEKLAGGFDRNNTQTYFSQGWFSRLALARMNATPNLDTLIAGVELFPEKSIRVSRLLKQLAYTRHIDAFRLLLNYLKSTDTVSDGGFTIPVCAYATEFLSIYLDGFPVKTKYFNYSKEEIALGIAYLEKLIGKDS